MHLKPVVLFHLCSIILVYSAKAQSIDNDTLKLTIRQAENRFLQSNLNVIIQHYGIDAAQAQVLTARLFPNPDFSLSNGIYANNATDGPAYKEQSASISQLFTTAGKRNKNIKLQQLGVEQAKYQFFDLLRTLKLTLRGDFYTVYYQRRSAKVYNQEISSLDSTLVAYRGEYAKGYIAQKELLRIEAQLYSLQAEYSSLLTTIDTTESQLKLFMRVPVHTAVEPLISDSSGVKEALTSVPYQRLLDSAYTNRFDLRYSKVNLAYNDMNLQLQKATAVPDISLSLNFDKLGGYGTNFLGGGIDFSLPFFDRNQGNIKLAKINLEQSKLQYQVHQDLVESDVALNYKIAMMQEKVYNSFDPKFKPDFTHLIQEVYKNYKKRNISLLEFLDYYDTYKTNTLLMNNQLLSYINALEQLNFVTGTPFYNQ
jgi:cobalt-zinc-cadmium efflux system outer membrane protein